MIDSVASAALKLLHLNAKRAVRKHRPLFFQSSAYAI
ncbi:hypothetical protein EV561_102408 [Rhizobium sp. BK376]|nr:hypothetical protein EV561_102408 [Rhizobium sp. BK376]